MFEDLKKALKKKEEIIEEKKEIVPEIEPLEIQESRPQIPGSVEIISKPISKPKKEEYYIIIKSEEHKVSSDKVRSIYEQLAGSSIRKGGTIENISEIIIRALNTLHRK